MVTVTTVSDGVATVTLARPETKNALSDAVFSELVGALQELDARTDVRCIVVAGQPDAFSAGADLNELLAQSATQMLVGHRAELWRSVRAIRVPLVAAVSGYCLGGGFELALACDLIVASPTATFGQPELGVGLIPGGGGTQLLVRLVGRAVAADLVLTGRRLEASEAHALGLVARLSGNDDWLQQAQAVAQGIARSPIASLILAKQALSAALELPLTGGLGFERTAFCMALGSPEAQTRIREFVRRRAPTRQGD